MHIARSAQPLRTDLFPTVQREVTRSICIQYTGTAPDPRIDSSFLDWDAARQGFFGVTWHYVVLLDGTIEIARDPKTRSSRVKSFLATAEALHIGIVGGVDPETCEHAETITPEQDAAVEWLMQAIANALNVPLEVFNGRENWTSESSRRDELEETEAAEEEAMDRTEELASRA